MDTTLVQLDLHEDVRTTPQVDQRLLELNVDKKSGVYSVVGYVLDSKTVAQHVAVKFRLLAVLRKGQPHIFVDDRITLTPTSYTHIKRAFDPAEIVVYKLKTAMLMDGVCLMPGEELAVRIGPRLFLCMNETEIQITREFLQAIKLNSEQKTTYSFVVAEDRTWKVSTVLAYSKDDALGRITPSKPHFITDTALTPGEYHTEDLLHCGSCWTPMGAPSSFLTNVRGYYSNRIKLEDIGSGELESAWRAMLDVKPRRSRVQSNLP